MYGFMYSADVDGRGRTRTDADGRGLFLILIFLIEFKKKKCVFFVGIHWSTGLSDRFGHPPPTHHDLMKIYWVYHPDSTWRNVLALSPLAQLRWHNVGMVVVGTTTVAQRHLANVGPTYFCQPYANDVGHVGKNKKWKYLFFDFLRGHLFSRCQIQN